MNKPYEAVHLAMFFWYLLKEVDGERVDGDCVSFQETVSPSTLRRWMGQDGG